MDVDTGHGVIELRRHNNRDELLMSRNRHVYRPFVKQDKSYVKMMYEKYNVLDYCKLFKLTANSIGNFHTKQTTVKNLVEIVYGVKRDCGHLVINALQ